MTTVSLSPLAALENALRVLRSHFWFLLALLLGAVLAVLCASSIGTTLLQRHLPLGYLVQVSTVLLAMLSVLGIVRVCLRLFDSDDASPADLLDAAEFLVSGLVVSLLVALLSVLALLPLVWFTLVGASLTLLSPSLKPLMGVLLALLGVSSLYSLARFLFCAHLVVDRHLGPLRALRGSADLTRQTRTRAVVLLLLLGALNLFGLLCAGVGLLVTLPLSLLTLTAAYRQLVPHGRTISPGPSQEDSLLLARRAGEPTPGREPF